MTERDSVAEEIAHPVRRVYSVSSIYLLIAGTYTPFALVNLRGAWGWSPFSVAWRFALFGIVLEAVAQQRVRVLSVVLYLGLGWLVAKQSSLSSILWPPVGSYYCCCRAGWPTAIPRAGA